MSSDLGTSCALVGRFYRLDKPIGPDCNFVEGAGRFAWTEEGGRGRKDYVAFCSGCPPHDGDLENDPTDLSYSDHGTGVVRMWIREEERSVGRVVRKMKAEALARELPGHPELGRLSPKVRKSLLDRAEQDLLDNAIPKVRVVPVVLWQDRCWIGNRSVVIQHRSLMYGLVGGMRPDPVAWCSGEAPGWSELSTATVLSFCSRPFGSKIEPDVDLQEIDIGGHAIRCKTTETGGNGLGIVGGVDLRSFVEKILRESEGAKVRRLSFEVVQRGEGTFVSVDDVGVCRVQPPPSKGGLPSDRISRRLDDAYAAGLRIGEVMRDLASKIESDGNVETCNG